MLSSGCTCADHPSFVQMSLAALHEHNLLQYLSNWHTWPFGTTPNPYRYRDAAILRSRCNPSGRSICTEQTVPCTRTSFRERAKTKHAGEGCSHWLSQLPEPRLANLAGGPRTACRKQACFHDFAMTSADSPMGSGTWCVSRGLGSLATTYYNTDMTQTWPSVKAI